MQCKAFDVAIIKYVIIIYPSLLHVAEVTVWYHFGFNLGLVAGSVVTGELTVSNDNLHENNFTVSLPLEIPGDVSGVTAVRNNAIDLFFIDNDGRTYITSVQAGAS